MGVRFEDRAERPAGAYDPRRGQHSSTRILEWLEARRPAGTHLLAVLVRSLVAAADHADVVIAVRCEGVFKGILEIGALNALDVGEARGEMRDLRFRSV